MLIYFDYFSPALPAVLLRSVGPDGNLLFRNSTVLVGDNVEFGAEVTPGGLGDCNTSLLYCFVLFFFLCLLWTPL